MILKIHRDKYYGYNGKNKNMFKKKYRAIGLKWMTSVNFNEEIVDGWFNDDKSQYLLKLQEKEGFKRFMGNSEKIILFLKSIGAEEYEGDEKGVHVDYGDMKGFVTQQDRYGCFVGADLISHYRTEELLENIPDNFGVVWERDIIP